MLKQNSGKIQIEITFVFGDEQKLAKWKKSAPKTNRIDEIDKRSHESNNKIEN